MTSTPHDALFKATFSQPEHAAAAIREALSTALAARIDFASLTLRAGSFIDERLAQSHSDLLFSARLDGESTFLYVLFEHQSKPDPLMAFRLLEYMIRIWQAHLERHPKATRLPAILPLVLHHSEAGWTASVAFHDLLDLPPAALTAIADHVPQFRFVLDDISKETDEALRSRAMTALGRLVLWCFRHARNPRQLVARLAEWRDVVREVRRAPGGGAALGRVWRYILAVMDRGQPEAMFHQLLEAAGPEATEEIVSIADYFREQGRLDGERQGRLDGERQGRLDGERQGRLDGQRSSLMKLLRLRYGDLPEAALARIGAADAARIEAWTERVLTAPTLAEALAEP